MIISKLVYELITQNLTETLSGVAQIIPYNSSEWFLVNEILVDPSWRYRLDSLPTRMLPSSDDTCIVDQTSASYIMEAY